VQLHRPDTSWSAVLRGGVLCGVEKDIHSSLIHTTAFKKSYGIVLYTIPSNVNSAGVDLKRGKYDQRMYNDAQLVWMFNKGDVILDGSATSVTKPMSTWFTGAQSGARKTVIYSYEEDNRPKYWHDSHQELTVAGTLAWDLSNVPACDIAETKHSKKGRQFSANLRVKLLVRDNQMEAVLLGSTQEICRTRLDS
jgi:hypothetical protein